MSDATTSGGPDDAASSGDAVEGKAVGRSLSASRRRCPLPTRPDFCAAERRFSAPDCGGHTDDMGKHDIDDTDESTDDAVEQRTLRAFDGGIDGREAGEGDDTELRERIEKAEEDIEALRELLDTAVDTISELSDSMTGHDTNDDGEANSDYEPAPETAESARGFQ